ncbi:FxsA family protein [Candidatus Ishikawella capsulata]|uniref:Inner membrane protein n=1 Tax=Candidatus Ishikawaella capsulata Mpkobe TaxID=476281 RepID=C5WDP1_9ENTR|nr:FxsA family protein [Candidatus Ishikawaella capsulata]BAH83447.1 inner membrane protein [Candidatus Ishikawaella capsulata Mpkobe]
MFWLFLIFLPLILGLEFFWFMHILLILGMIFAIILTIYTFFIGISFLKYNFRKQYKFVESNNISYTEIIKKLSLISAIIWFILPGFFTNVLGVIILLPLIHEYFVLKLVRYFTFDFDDKGQSNTKKGHTIEGEYENLDEDKE